MTLFAFLVLLQANPAQEARPRFPEVAEYGEAIVVRKDLAYGDEAHQKFDLYLPKKEGPHPVVVCYHGGGFVRGRKEDLARAAAFLAARGFAAATPGYFLAGKETPGWPRNVQDARLAAAFLRERAKEHGLDPERVALLGTSAGAYLALMVGFTAEPASAVRAVVSIAGVSDRRESFGTGTEALLGKDYAEKPELRAKASPIVHVTAKSPPVYLLHGLEDKTVSPESARKLAAALKEAGVSHRLHLVEGAGHQPLSPAALGSIADWLKERFAASR